MLDSIEREGRAPVKYGVADGDWDTATKEMVAILRSHPPASSRSTRHSQSCRRRTVVYRAPVPRYRAKS